MKLTQDVRSKFGWACTGRNDDIGELPSQRFIERIFEHLKSAGVKNGAKGEMAVFSTQAGRSGFPFALRRESISVVEEQMRRGEFSLQELAHALRARRIEFNARAAQELFNVNTPEELAAARERMKKPAGLRA